jgi:ribosomal protein S19
VPPIKTQARAATILPNFVGLIFQVHNGKVYNDVRITEDMVGHKLGEFSAYVRFCRRKWKDRSDSQQHTKALHVQADEEQVEGENGLHGNGANTSLDHYTTGKNSVKYLYTMALRIEEPTAIKKVQEPQKPGISPRHAVYML